MGDRIRDFLNSSRFRYLATALVVVLLVGCAVLVKRKIDSRTFSHYEVEKAEKKADSVSRFAYCDGYAVRYSSDGASLVNKDLESVWTSVYQMTDPRVDVSGGEVLIYDRGGTDLFLYNRKEKIASFSAELPILLARISGKNTVAALLQEGEKTEFVYYTKEGGKIAAGESTMSDPGYPFAMAISEDGMHVAVSYLTATGGTTGSTIRFYSFDSKGKAAENNMTGELVLTGTFAPDVQYLGSRCVVFRDDGFTIVRDPAKQDNTIVRDFDRDIVSVFHDRSHIGVIFRSDEKTHLYQLFLYNPQGEQVCSAYIDHPYTRIHVCDGQILVSGETSLSIFTLRGVCRFSGSINEGTVADALKIGRNRCLVLTDQTMEVIRLR